MPAASRSLRAFFGNGFCAMPTTTTSFAAIAACTSRTMSVRWVAIVSRIAGWMWASSRMGRGIDQNVAGSTLHHVRPGNDDLAPRPRFTRERLPLLLKDAGNPEGGRRQSLDDERPRIDEDLREVRKIIRLAIEDQQARLRRDRDAHLVGDLLPGATDERFLRDEHLDVLLELALEVARNEAEVGDASNENVAPGRG